MEFDEIEIDKSFQLCNGKILRNPKDLKDYTSQMSDDVYKYHVSNGKNDFSFWLKNCWGQDKLANSIFGIKRKETFIRKILEA